MALLKQTFRDSISRIWLPESDRFVGRPKEPTTAAFHWAQAFGDYFLQVTPSSTTVFAARVSLSTSLARVFSRNRDDARRMGEALDRFALAVAGGMQPAFTATPPIPFPVEALVEAARLLPWRTTPSGPQPDYPSGLALWVDAVDAWARTGTATSNGSGGVIPWS